MLLKELAEASGPSGHESEIRQLLRRYIAEALPEFNSGMVVDALGNLIVAPRNQSDPSATKPRVMLSAHMDEVGMMITYIEASGWLRFRPLGGIDPRVLVSKPVLVGKDRIPGVIGAKPIHLQEKEERNRALKVKDLFIDLGCNSKEEAEKLVKIGDAVVFATSYTELGERRIRAKALDDRAGCAILLDLMVQCRDLSLPVYYTFTAQEEVGLRGAQVAAYRIEPQVALAIEVTTASDVPESKEAEYCSSLGQGPVITVMDRSLVSPPRLWQRLVAIAEANNIPYQLKQAGTGGTDAGAISLTRAGVPAAVVSVPARYIHSPASLLDKVDMENTYQLVLEFLRDMERRGLLQ
ncbi:MAG: M42 family metallopeptidase [Clostridia bacterium]|nr:M42 family metallopeptidase [Clostridia bacterium]